jgi:hypothetical protein
VIRLLPYAVLVIASAACTTFSTIRSAEVRPGPGLTVQGAMAWSPGDAAGWFWSIECESHCNHAIAAMDFALAFGSTGAMPVALGFGLNGTSPYVDGYLQLNKSRGLPFGVGARIGLPFESWNEHQVYGRLDIPLARDARLLYNPGVFYHTGTSPNGQNPGSFLGIVQAVGMEMGDGSMTITPGLSLVLGRAERNSYGDQIGPEHRPFLTTSVAIAFKRKRQ